MFHSKLFRITIIVAPILFIAGIGFYFLQKEISKPCPYPISEPKFTSPQAAGAGTVGEVTIKKGETGEDISLVTPEMPPVIFSTSGTVREVSNDRIVIRGDGTNFTDGVQRDISVIFTKTTLTFGENYSANFKGEKGLNYLKPGIKVLIESEENIRGKVEFNAKTVNIL